MQEEFWHKKWNDNQIGFHQEKINSRLQKLWQELELQHHSKILVPLCGKSLDMIWLADQGHEVMGIELSEVACKDFFTENHLAYTVSTKGNFTIYRYENISLWAGNIFDLSTEDVSEVQGVYDRAALVALPKEMRQQYAHHLIGILPLVSKLMLISMEYDESKMKGPPFSVTQGEVEKLFLESYLIEILSHSSGPDIVGNLKQRGLDTLDEKVYRLASRFNHCSPSCQLAK